MSRAALATPAATLRVLLVEDDEDDYVLARDLLEHTGRTGVSLCWES